MRRVIASVILVPLLLTGGTGAVWAGQYASVQSVQQGTDPALLVRQLGARSFAVRRAATARLIELGPVCITALQQGVQSTDREISYRSKHVLKIVNEDDFQRRLRAFASGRGQAASFHLPGWARFAKEVGTGPKARALFVEMQQAEAPMLAASENNPDEIEKILINRLAELQMLVADNRQENLPSLGTISSILFILNGHELQLSLVLTQSIGSYFRYPSFATAIQSGSQRDLLRKMLSTWIERSHGWDAYHAMYLSMQYNLPVGLVPARRILEGELQQQNESHFLCYALLTFARFGDESHFELIEPLLENKSPYGGTIAVAGNAKYRTQIRDIALATLVQLAKLNHRDFGFDRFRTNGSLMFNTTSLAFQNDELRDQAIAKWWEYRQAKSR